MTLTIKWYERILSGDPLPWALTQRIALEVTAAEWDAGPSVVAERIAEIRGSFEQTPLDQDALGSHTARLAKSPVFHADVAQSAANQIEAAIVAFKRDAPSNCLPEGFAAFENLPTAFTSIATSLTLQVDATVDLVFLKEEINRLHRIIGQLRQDLQTAKTQLSDGRLSAPEAKKTRKSGETLRTTLTNITLIGSLGAGALLFFGIPPEEWNYETLKDALQSLTQQMIDIETADPNEVREQTIDV